MNAPQKSSAPFAGIELGTARSADLSILHPAPQAGHAGDPISNRTVDGGALHQVGGSLKAENRRLRNKLLELANECAECDGGGCTTVKLFDVERTVPCAACLDIRELLA